MNRIAVLSFGFRRGFHVCRGYGRLIVGPARSTVYGLLIPAALMTTHGLFAQGNLNPPGAPGPTFKTLSQIEPRTPISSLPFTITNSGSYYVTTNLFGTRNTDVITISSNHVALDLNGFA